jgi:hypothetical protein
MITMNATALLVPMARAASPEATHGCRMAIADALLSELGGGLTTEPHPYGKTVGARLPGALL